jgi:hypothetical protein
MALTVNSRTHGVDSRGKRYVDLDCTFSDGTAANVTAAVSGLEQISEVWVKAKASGGTGVDLTANTGALITLDPVAAITNVIIRVIGTD